MRVTSESTPSLPAPSPPEARGGWFTRRQFTLGLALTLLAAFPLVVLGRESFYFRDFGLFGYPLAYYHREGFWRGDWPLWNPYNVFGMPFLAQWNTLVLYPGSLLYLVLPLPWSLNLFCLAHLCLGGVGMYTLGWHGTKSRLGASVAGVAFALNGVLLCSLKWPNNIAVLGWMPWVVWLVERAWREGRGATLRAALVATVQMLAGTPELILLTWVVVGALWAAQMVQGRLPRAPMVRRLAAVMGLTAALSAAQLLPFLDLLAHSQRNTQFGGSGWAMPWWGWGNFLVPLFHCFRSHQGVFAQLGQYWIASYYLGLPVVGAALWSLARGRRKRVWALGMVGGVSLWLAMGDAGGLYGGLRHLIPFLGFMRFPIKFVVPCILVVPWMAAFAVADWEGMPLGERERALRWVGAGLAIALLAIGLVLWWAHDHPFPTDDWTATWHNGLGRGVFLGAAGLCWWGWARTPRAESRRWLGLAGLVVVGLDVLAHAPWQNPTVPSWVLAPGVSELQPAPTLGQARAMVSPAAAHDLDHWVPPDPTRDYLASRLGLFANCNLLDHIPKVDGFYSLYLEPSALVQRLLYHTTNTAYPRLNDFLGVAQITRPGRTVAWAPRSSALPWITGGQAVRFASRGDTLRALASPEFAPEAVVYLPLEARPHTTVTNRVEVRVTAARWTARSVEVQVQAEGPARIVVAQAFYHDWEAFVNGRPTPIERANLAFQTLEVPAGPSRVRLVYRDRAFAWGVFASVVTLVGCGVGWWRWRAGPSPRGQ